MTNKLLLVALAPFLIIFGFLFLFVLLLAPGTGAAQTASCAPAGPALTVDTATLPSGAVAGYGGEQLKNAALIMQAATLPEVALDSKAEVIGVMTAMGESRLRVLDNGDAAGPDSRGLFQQRANGAWGSYQDRMNPTTSAKNFYLALKKVPDWQHLSPTIAAHRVQGNADPNHYAPFWDPAVQVVEALAHVKVSGAAQGTGALSCTAQAPAQAPAGGSPPPAPGSQGGGPPAGSWVRPAAGPLTSGFGERWGRPHKGIDIGAPCSAPIVAAADGIVIQAGPVSGYGNLIQVDHGGGIVTAYAHMYADGILVVVGHRVRAGDQVARVGSAGDSTGCHLHFEVRVQGAQIDPQPFLRDRGVTV